MFNIIRIPTKYSKTISRFSEKDKSILLKSLISIGNGKVTPLEDNILGDTIGLIYGDWMRMESKNGVKPKKPLIQYISEGPALVPASMSPPTVQYSTIRDSTIQYNNKPQKIKIFEGDSFEFSASSIFLKSLVDKQVPSILYQLKHKTELELLQSWALEVNKMINLDGLDIEQIREIIKFTIQDEFWSTVILSMKKFRQKKDGIPYFITIINKIKDSGGFQKDTSQMTGDEAIAEAKKLGLL